MTRVTQKKVVKRAAGTSARPRSTESLLDECRRLRAQCREHALHIEASERLYQDTVTTVSHDIRNPLSVILMSAKLLLRSVGSDTPARKQIDAIERAADEINQLAEDLADAMRIERGALRVYCEPQEVAPIVDRAIDAVMHTAVPKQVEITRELGSDLPAIAADQRRLVQVLTCLLGNAVRFTPKGGRITLRAEPHSSGARFSVTDSGPGIPPDQHEQLFTRYPPTRRPPTQGMGLALFVTKGIVEAHGGRIWVKSQPGAGTRVFFTIPAASSVETHPLPPG